MLLIAPQDHPRRPERQDKYNVASGIGARESPKRAASLQRVRNEFHVSKVVQLRAAISPRGFALPQHLHLMSRDAGNRARSVVLAIVLANPDDAVAQR